MGIKMKEGGNITLGFFQVTQWLKKKKMPANARDMGSIPGVRNGNPLAWKVP